MNEHSSRAHTIFRMIVESRKRTDKKEDADSEAVNVSQLTFVDLAGSERVAQTGATGERLKEGQQINRSLFHLSQVVCQLSDGKYVILLCCFWTFTPFFIFLNYQSVPMSTSVTAS